MTLNLNFGSCSIAVKMLNSVIFVLTCSKASNRLTCKCGSRNTGLETPLKCNINVKVMIQRQIFQTLGANFVVYFSKKVQHTSGFCFAFLFSVTKQLKMVLASPFGQKCLR